MRGVRTVGWIWMTAVLLGSKGPQALDVGHEGPSYAGIAVSPTGTKPQSKLWTVNGDWWACLWSVDAQSYTLWRLDAGTQTWIDTGVAADARSKSLADCLWDGAKLYVASHQFTSGPGSPGHPLLLFRYSYDPNARLFSLDPSFPAQIGDSTTETLVLDKDSTGTLWAVWMSGLRVWYAHSESSDRLWSPAAILPGSLEDVASDDICSLVHFGGARIGVMWSDEIQDTYWFSVHADGDPAGVWSSREAALSGPGQADDHIHLRAAEDGRVFAALKTGTDEILLGERSGPGAWTIHLVSTAAEAWTRPIVVLDEEDRTLHCFATSPVPFGTIYEKVSSMDAIAFPAGLGTPVIERSLVPLHNDVTSTKQSVSSESGLVVMASHQEDERYWHHFDALGGAQPHAPTAHFAADPRTGFAALSVQFIDGSSGLPDTWSWDFGDGQSSSERHPQHVYAQPGTYTVTLTVENALGLDTLQQLDAITVASPPSSLVLAASEDAQVRQASPDSNYGALEELRVRQDVSSDYHAFLKFDVPATGSQISSATLRLWVNDGSPDGGTLHAVSSDWGEASITWNTAPTFGQALGNLGAVTTDTWVELDVTSAIALGPVAFGLESASTNSVFYSSREGTHPPELHLGLVPPTVPSPLFDAQPRTGFVPLVVEFSDLSGGAPDGWTWEFGDGSTSHAQNPVHVYRRPGTYSVRLTLSKDGVTDSRIETDFVEVRPLFERGRR